MNKYCSFRSWERNKDIRLEIKQQIMKLADKTDVNVKKLFSQREIASTVGVSEATVSVLLKRKRTKRGRKAKLDGEGKRFIIRLDERAL